MGVQVTGAAGRTGPVRRGVALARATHLEPALAVSAVAVLLAVAAGVTPGRTVLVGAAVLAGQASIGWCNDWLDADRDRAVGRQDKPVVQGVVTPATLRTAALTAVAVAVVLSLLLGVVPGLLLLVLVASGWAYDAGLKRTALSPLPYLTGFGALPAGVVAAAPGTPAAPWWLVAAGAALGGAAHVANVAPDVADDLATGVRGLPHRVGPVPSAVAGAVLLGAASLLLVLGPAGPPSALERAAGVLAVPAVVVAALAGSPRARRLAFPAVLLLTVLDVVLLVAGGAALG
ncbi:4-hydroxybenzoate polyprenyltransferase-like prenyltransferase [Modestobacter italicus]|uniref:4-hydroxybenzoate polyprenyltransferase-like prenyltransferase n=1 Tax=Modestobacter italicus (strain DSM 44449 / CECT 9708 / BC 501) TaxID=2732864 RepID=I4ES47_MODI5|nr:UbiA family prenyltransferase [Modestobacter marinus]CCH86210.1 4-hydroxybenzoate polyprenyltransferase-like prenyltransferase [Modestobacter marinus]